MTRFHDFSTGVPAARRGRLKSYADPAGGTTSAAYTSGGLVSAVTRTGTVGGATLTESLTYTYLASPDPNAGLVATVTLERQLGSGGWQTVRSVAYAYYDGVEAHGLLGDLKTATVKDAAGDPVETKYYRYYTAGGGTGYAHGLKYLLEGDAYNRLTAAHGTNLAAVTDTQLAPFADLYFEYDSQQRVTKEMVQGAGCSVCSAGQGEYTFAYTASANAAGVNAWARKTVETLPDGNTHTAYTNAYGQVMLWAYTEAASGDKWATFYQYDGDGRVVRTAAPSAVSGWNDTYADLLHWDGDDYEYLRDAEGLVTVVGYGATTTATASAAGSVAGYQASTAVGRGEAGAPVVLSSLAYIAHTAGGATVYQVADATAYRNADGTGAETTHFAYTYFTGTTRVESVVTTLPAVTAARNGSGAADAAAAVFDARGRMIWMKDEGGFLTHAAYDEGTGAVVKWVTDVDTARTSDFTALPSGWSTPAGGGLHLVSAFEVDSLGRVTTATTPEGRVTYTRYDDDRHEVRTYAGWDATAHRPTGPTAVARDDWAGGYTEVLTMSAAPALDGGNRPTGAEAVGQLQSLSRTYRNTAGQVTHRDEYFDLTGLTHTTSTTLGTEGTHFYRTRYQYDARGWLNKTVSPQGTIYRTVSDGQGRAVSDWVGTDDTPTAGFWSPTNLAGANMVKVREYEYDGGGVGDGNLTKVTEIPGADSPDRVTRTWYDWRNRAVAVKAGVQGTEAADVNRPLTYLDLDNLGRAVRTRVYDADGVTPTATAGVPDPLSAGLLRAQSTTGFDERGRVYRTDASAVDPATGAVGASLNTSVWYDARGNVVKSAAPGGLVSKAEFDGAGRQTRAYLTDGGGDGGYADADDVAGDVVLEQSETTYDKDGNALLVVTRQRFHDATGTGALGTPTTGVGARVSYAASYYDPASRTTAVADVGTNGGSAWTRPTTAPARSDTVLVSSFEYAADAVQTVRLTGSPTGGTFTLTAGGQTTAGIAYDATPAAVDAALEALSSVGTGNVAVSAAAGGGWEVRFTGTLAGKHQAALVGGGSGLTGGSSPGVAVGTVSAGGDAGRVAAATDPRGLVARTYADTLGRTVRRVENWADGVVSDTDDKTTDFTHNGVGMTSLTARLAGGGGQTTEWVFGSLGPVASNDVVGETRWPDPSTGAASGTDRELVVADAFGGYLSVARNGTVHQLYYDPLGRVFADVAYAGPGVDDAVLRIDTAYDGQGNAYLVTSRDYSGNVVHQLRREYNGFGQLVAEWQQRGAAVNTSTSPKVGYQYSSPAGGVNHSRLIRVTYPSGYELSYDHAPGLDGRIGRLSSLSDAAGVVERYDYLGLGGVVRRQHPQPGTELTYVGTPADAGDQYAGLDRFGRVADHRWRLSGGAGSDLSRYQYGHDRNGNRLFRDDLLGLASDELYGYDGLDQVASFERGTLNTARTALTGTAARTQTWDYDALGNWESLTTDGTARARTHNRQNEVAGVAGAAATPTYDGDGNMTGDEAGRQLVYDAWNRLVAVKDAGGTTLRTYAYDGLNRRVAETVTATGVTTDLLYSAGWQVLEERVGSDTAARYVWSPVYVDALVLRDRDTDGNGSLDERLWAVQDANFNVVALLNGSGAVVERYAYDPFGAATVLDASYAVRTGGSSYGWRHLHQGLRYDAAAAQYDNYGRWYSPTLGRFTGLDPLRFAAGDVNLYRYVENGPTGRVDPSGLQPPLGPPKPLVFVPTTSPIANVTPTQYGYIKAGLENKIALDQVRANVPPDKLKLAIEFYEKTAKGPLNERAGPASAFNQARADFLRGAGPAPGGNLADFAKRAVPGGRAGGAVRAGSLVLRIAPPLALGAGLLWLADQAVEPPDSPVAPFLGGGGKSGDGGKFDGPITIPKNSTLINRLNTKCGTLQTWKLPNGEIITIEKIDR